MIEPTDVYTGPERRRSSAVPLEPLEGVVERLMVKILARHEQTERAMWDEMMSRAFPDGDPESHRDYHQAKIDAAVAEKEFYQSLKMKLAEAGALGALKLVLWLLMMGLGAAIAGKFGVLPLFFGGAK